MNEVHEVIGGYSPRMWGWTKIDNAAAKTRIPHGCGGGPKRAEAKTLLDMYSPRMWGWTEIVRRLEALRDVFPTDVGVDRW